MSSGDDPTVPPSRRRVIVGTWLGIAAAVVTMIAHQAVSGIAWHRTEVERLQRTFDAMVLERDALALSHDPGPRPVVPHDPLPGQHAPGFFCNRDCRQLDARVDEVYAEIRALQNGTPR